MDAQFFFPYHEPSLKQILTLSSFLVFLNGFRVVGDRLANVGILGKSSEALNICFACEENSRTHMLMFYTYPAI